MSGDRFSSKTTTAASRPSDSVTRADIANLDLSPCGDAKRDLARHRVGLDGLKFVAKAAGTGTGASYGAHLGTVAGLPGIVAGAVIGGAVGYGASKFGSEIIPEISGASAVERELEGAVNSTCAPKKQGRR